MSPLALMRRASADSRVPSAPIRVPCALSFAWSAAPSPAEMSLTAPPRLLNVAVPIAMASPDHRGLEIGRMPIAGDGVRSRTVDKVDPAIVGIAADTLIDQRHGEAMIGVCQHEPAMNGFDAIFVNVDDPNIAGDRVVPSGAGIDEYDAVVGR